MRRIGICFMITLLAMAFCSVENAVPAPAPKVEPTYYVLCDFSASQGQQSLQAIVENADTIFRKACIQKARSIYMDISAPAFEKPFFDCRIVNPRLMTPAARRQQLQELAAKADTLHRRMVRTCQRPSSKSTCIIRTIEKVANAIPRDIAPDKRDHPVKIVILSDLLEDCLYGTRRVNIDRGDFATAFRMLSKMAPPTATFSICSNVEVTLVASSHRSIKKDSLDLFWKEVFRKFDHKLEGSISSSLPQWVQGNGR